MGTSKPSYLSLTDLFCGAGGASIGAEAAGLKLVLGINHWQLAIQTHSENFPNAAHDCRDVSETHPSRYRSTHLLWASPECPTWSGARGKKRDEGITGQLALVDDGYEPLPTEAEERSRVTMWDVVRYAEYHRYEAVVVENVVDVMPWSLLPAWYQAMETLGYDHRTLFLNSMFFGVPQSRDRWYTVFWKRRNRAPDLEFRPQAWCPRCEAVVEARQSFKPHAAATARYGPRQQYVYLCPGCTATALPFVAPAAAAIDWSVLGERIGDRRRPLAKDTMARIQAGIDRYWRRPVVIDTLRDPKWRDVDGEPLATQTGRQSQALYIPLLTHLRGSEPSQLEASSRPVADPMRTISAKGNHHGFLAPPLYVKNYGPAEKAGPMTHPAGEAPLGSITAIDHHALLTALRAHARTWPVTEVLHTVVTANEHALVTPINGGRHGTGGHKVRTTSDPLTTQTGDLARALVTSYYGRESATRPVGEPMGTVTGNPQHALVFGIERAYHGRQHQHVRSQDDPLETLTTGQAHALVVPMDQRGPGRHNRSRTASDPLRTQTTGQADGLVVPAGGTWRREATSIGEPLPARTGSESDAFVTAYTRTNRAADVAEPVHTITTHDRHGLVERGETIAIEDCLFRMLMPAEIGRGMAFPDTYRVLGRQQKERVQQYGQAVTPPVAAWIWQRILESLR
jgi:DNA (cytosine-5)-methyltransferase 1